ncbi:hypothetical protein ACLB2K_035019 [Fragaria x ananassa]
MRHELSELDLYFNPTQSWRDNSDKLELKLPRRVVRCKTLEVLKVHSNCITYPSTSPDSQTEEEITINAPKLQNLVVYVLNPAKYIMQNVNSLVKADIENTYIRKVSPWLLNCETALLAGVSRVEYLNLPGLKFETCSLPNFSNVKQLKLNLFGCSYLEYVMELLKRTPKLEDLVLDIDFRTWYDEEYEGYIPFEPPEIVPICVVSHLKTVSITQHGT